MRRKAVLTYGRRILNGRKWNIADEKIALSVCFGYYEMDEKYQITCMYYFIKWDDGYEKSKSNI